MDTKGHDLRFHRGRVGSLNCFLAIGLCVAFPALITQTAGAQADVPGQTPGGGLLSRNAIALNSITGKIYAVESDQGAVAVIDGKTAAASSIKVGADPVALTINPATNRIYVANHGSGTVSVLDGNTDRLVATLDVGSLPYSLAVNPKTNKVYVSRVYSSLDSIIDGATNTITSIKAGSADALLVDPDRDDVYMLGYEGGNLTLLHGDSMSTISTGKMHIWGMAFDSATATLYVTRIGNSDLVALDARTHSITPIAAGSMPCAIAINTRTRKLYVVNYADETLSVIDAVKRLPIATVSVGHHPQAVAVDESTNLVYVANTLDSTITVIDGASNKVAATLKGGKNPHAIAVDAPAGAVYVADESDLYFTRIDVSGLKKTTP